MTAQRPSLPSQISTGCPELDLAWKSYGSMILEHSQILIPDTDDDLTWHAFLAHSIDMQGFRAAEFAGVDPLTRTAPKFVPLKARGIGVPELGLLWEIPEIRQHLLGKLQGVPFAATLDLLRKSGGEIGGSLAEAFEYFPWRKFHWSVRALLQNSAVLKPFGYSFRKWLRQACVDLGLTEFPPPNFRKAVTYEGTRVALEMALRKRLEQTFYMVGPAMSAYMLCDWQMWLWREGQTEVFANFKQDSFHEAFVKAFGRGVVPATEAGFARWWHELLPHLPPRLANECIWLAVENKLVHPWAEPSTAGAGSPSKTQLQDPLEPELIEGLRDGVRRGKTHDTGVVSIGRQDESVHATTTPTGGEPVRESTGDLLVIVPCGRSKVWDQDPTRGSIQARDVYTSRYFQTNRAFAERFGSRWVILSAKYGFIRPEFLIPGPYNVSFEEPATRPVEVPTLIDQIQELRLGDA